MSDVILRKFWLENETGDSIPLNGERGIWLVDPTGLGVNNNSTFTNFSYGFFSPVEEDKDPQQTIAGDLYFIDPIDPYMMYRRFVDWVSLAKTLYLVYSPTPTRYRRKIKLSYLTKTELTTQQCLKAPIAMYGLTPWFTKTEYRIEGEAGALTNPFRVSSETVKWSVVGPPVDEEEEEGEEKEDEEKAVVPVGRLRADSRYRVSTIIYATGHRDAAFNLSFGGGLLNPEIRICGYETGNVYGSCTMTDTMISAGEVFLYSSDYGNSYILKQSQYGTTDLLNSVDDLGSDIYPKIPLVEPCILELSSMSEIAGRVNITVINYYRGV